MCKLEPMPLCKLVNLQDDGELPNNIEFKIVGGKTLYKRLGWMWRNSPNQIFLSKHDEFDDNEYARRRYLPNETMIQIIKKD